MIDGGKRFRRFVAQVSAALVLAGYSISPDTGIIEAAELKVIRNTSQLKSSSATANTITLKLSGEPGTYNVYSSTDSRQWQYLGRQTIGAGESEVTFSDGDATTFQFRFYRLVRIDDVTGESLEKLPVVGIQVARDQAYELGSVPAIFFISRDTAEGGPLTVGLQSRGRAVAGSDFAGLPDSITIPTGQKNIKLYIYPIDDQESEGTEDIEISVTEREYYSLSNAISAKAWINDDEAPIAGSLTDLINDPGPSKDTDDRNTTDRSVPGKALVTLELSHSQISEGSSDVASITLTRSGGTGGQLPVKINISGDAVQGKHIGRIPQSVSFSSGNNTLSIPVFVIDNTEHEADRTLVVQLGSGSGYVISNPAGLQLQILDNDTPEPQIVLVAQAGPDTSGQVNEWIQLNGSVTLNGQAVEFASASNGNTTNPVEKDTIPPEVSEPVVVTQPVANAGPNQNGTVNEWIQLNGSYKLESKVIQTASLKPHSGMSGNGTFL